MAGKQNKSGARRGGITPQPKVAGVAGVEDDSEAVRRLLEDFLDTPLPELLDDESLRAEAARMARQAEAVPALARLRDLVAFVGAGRPATSAGNLKLADAKALAERLGSSSGDAAEVRTLDDLPGVAHLFRWAVAAEFLTHRRGRIMPGPLAGTLADDPLSAWFKAAATRISHGVLDGFRSGWRKAYVPLLDGSVPILLAGLARLAEPVPLADLEELVWRDVAEESGIDRDDSRERAHLAKLLDAMFEELADLGLVTRERDRLAITELGAPLGAAFGLSLDDDGEIDDLVDEDALTLVSACAEMDVDLAWDAVAAWREARPDEEAADELAQAVEEASDDAGACAVAVVALLSLGDAAHPARHRLLGGSLPPILHDALRLGAAGESYQR